MIAFQIFQKSDPLTYPSHSFPFLSRNIPPSLQRAFTIIAESPHHRASAIAPPSPMFQSCSLLSLCRANEALPPHVIVSGRPRLSTPRRSAFSSLSVQM
ncbi:unnamed protein product [Cuscuta epithymum]|uniref:Uncharacterized protein n=1 Tax=Cuscuta epithymum TaxID=186058 RepID=A0AAV0FSA2_9ASTE|nr:unnamed protein product [Cuscuta epithymum]